jgi:hypothetical protein
MRLSLPSLLVAAAIAVVPGAPAAAQKPAGHPLVFVADVVGPAPLQQDAAALTTALCGALAKDPRIEVLCAPDVKQIMSFAAMGALTGGSSPAVDSLERRLAAVTWVVNGTLTQQPDGFGFVVAAGARLPDGGGGTPSFESASVRLEESVKGKSTRLVERLPELSTKVLKPLLAPTTTTTTAPPEPLK